MATLSGDFSLTLVDSLDLLAVMGNTTEFQRAVKLVIDTVHFDKSNVVQVRGTLEVCRLCSAGAGTGAGAG